AGRAPQEDGDHQHDVRDERHLRREETGVVGDEGDQQRADEAAADGTEAADDDDDERQHHDLAAHVRHERLLVQAPHDAAEARQRGAGREDAHEQAADAVAQRLDHLAVLDAGADQEADLRAVQGEEHRGEHDDADDDREQPVFLDGRLAQEHGAAQRGRQRQGDLLGAPDHVDELFGHDHAAHRDQDLFQMLAVDGHDDDALERPAEQRRHDHRE
ncbi:conserved hypothetical protein, partial [Ricinus communis]